MNPPPKTDKGRDPSAPAPSPAAYLRVSSTLQADANGTDAQRHALTAWALANGATIPPELWFEDAGVSGKTMQRPGWKRLMAAVDEGAVDTIVLYDLTRAGRTLKGLAEWIEQMSEKRVRVVFVKDGLDISTAIGRLVAHIMSAIAEYARHDIAERIRSGVRAKLDSGEAWGGARRTGLNKKGTMLGCARFTPDQWRAFYDRRKAGEALDTLALEAATTVKYLYRKFKAIERGGGPKTVCAGEKCPRGKWAEAAAT